MASALTLPATKPLSGFLLRWLGAALLPVAIAVPSTLVAIRVGIDYEEEVMWYVAIAGVLSHPVLSAIGQGYVTRGLLRRALLWGVLTGGGIVGGSIALMMAAFTLESFWWASVRGSGSGLFGLAGLPLVVLTYAAGGGLFGLVLGLLQGLALGMAWRLRWCWFAVTALAGMAAAAWLCVWSETPALSALLDGLGESVFDRGDWRGIPLFTAWFAAMTLIYALPTGLAMRRLLLRRQRADAEALARRFD